MEVIPDAVVAAVVAVVAGGDAVRVGVLVGFLVLGFAVVGTSTGLPVGHAVSSGVAGAVVGIPVGFRLAAGEEGGASGIFVGVGLMHSAPTSL